MGSPTRSATYAGPSPRWISANPVDDRENVAKEAMLERLNLQVELFEAHITASRVSVIAGRAQEIRSIFDLMPPRPSRTGPTSPPGCGPSASRWRAYARR